MNPEPNTYELSAEGKAKLKRKIKITLCVNYGIGAIVFLWNFSKQNLTIKYTLIGCVNFLLGTLIYNLRKTDKLIDSEKLEIGENEITLIKLGKPVKNLHITEIKSIDLNSYGVKLVSKYSSTPSLFISKNFESFEEIKSLIEEKVRLSNEAIA
ncbi:hypothetical protein [Mucilaginibacter polytrichastri]|uniref:DUF304 domain-containing protein n=1 Tax=Mucilaginibacter polytrichastri TaxID=1302689 RepID=A0A1Q6A6E1_9SPHI|nr:hypothetical protein [Mucilaginibacter polytrichastri]OKS89556.1 hypothetical protein RG47T_5040 [Mucilaginibacter polytrichastri]SFS70275.1 hypothetical protein SAMN04487890_10358 [Mucilaginibacter polytrichastri]